MDASQLIDEKIAGLGSWRGEMYARLRELINGADPNIKEDWKWGTAVWNLNGNVCAVGAFKNHVKVNFFKGISLKDPDKLLNSGFDSKMHRAIDLFEGDKLNEFAFQELIRAAIKLNV